MGLSDKNGIYFWLVCKHIKFKFNCINILTEKKGYFILFIIFPCLKLNLKLVKGVPKKVSSFINGIGQCFIVILIVKITWNVLLHIARLCSTESGKFFSCNFIYKENQIRLFYIWRPYVALLIKNILDTNIIY